MNYRIGLDLGIASVGWAVIEHDENEQPKRIENLGVRVFDKAEMPKDGASLSAKRREKRSARRIIRRKTHRIERVKFLLANTLITKKELEEIYSLCPENVYNLRYKALTKVLTELELSKVLLHLIKRRGFKSNRKSEASSKEGGKLLKAVNQNKDYMNQNGYKTIGEMIYKDTKYFEYDKNNNKIYKTRNKEEDYSKTFYRDDLVEEIKIIFDSQRKLGNKKASENLENLYLKIFTSQRSFDAGPGGNSPYKIDGFKVGKCTFEKEEDRTSKHAYTFEYFDALCRINNLKLVDLKQSRPLDEVEKKLLIDYIKVNKELKFNKLRKLLKLEESSKEFSYLKYNKDEDRNKTENKVFISMAKSYAIKKALFEDYKNLVLNNSQIKTIDEIALILSMYKEDEKRKAELGLKVKENIIPIKLSKIQIENLLILNPKQFGSLSIKAMQKLMPFLEEGLTYDKALKKVGYEHNFTLIKGEKTEKLKGDTLKEILNEVRVPVVKRAVSQAIKVINAIVNKYGSPQLIHVEVAREVSKSFKERNLLDKQNKENQKRNEKTKKEIKEEYGILNPSGTDIVKLKLYKDQCGKCAYSLKPLDIKTLFTNATQIDHIIPYSRSLDNSYNNKVLVLTSENQNKGNKTPYEYMASNKQRWLEFEKFVKVNIKSSRKRANLLREKFTQEDEKEWRSKNLNDTKYISRYILNVLQQKFKFAPSKNYAKKPVMAVNGRVTSYLRKVWGLTKIREDGDLHHALDASVIAMASDSAIKKITNYLKYKNNAYFNSVTEDELYAFDNGNIINKITGEIEKYIPKPYAHFTKELSLRLNYYCDDEKQNELQKQELFNLGYTINEVNSIKPIFVSRMPKRKMKGSINDDTIRSAKFINQNKTVIKTPLTSLKLTSDNKNIKGYPEKYKKDDRLLYFALLKRLQEFKGNAKEAFKDEFRKPKKDGTPGPVVKKVKIEETNNSLVYLDKMQGVAKKGDMIRVDIFTKDNKNYIVPVYVVDYYKGITPNKAIVAFKSEEEWLKMDASYKFKFSLYPNDLVLAHKFNKKITLTSVNNKNKDKLNKNKFMLYYINTGRSGGTIKFINHDHSYEVSSMGIQNLDVFEKYTVDVLGNYHKVGYEKRQMLERR